MRVLTFDTEFFDEPWNSGLLCVGWKLDGKPHMEDFPTRGLSGELEDALSDPDIPTVCHTKTDWRYLVQLGVDIGGPLFDTQVMAWILDENQPLDLETLARRYCDITMDKRIVIRDKRPFFRTDFPGPVVPLEEAPKDQLWAYNARDVEATESVFLETYQQLNATAWKRYWQVEELPFTKTLLDMEVAGMPIDLEASEELRNELVPEIADLDVDLHADAELPATFNLDSPDQLASYLYSRRVELKDSLSLEDQDPETLKMVRKYLKDPDAAEDVLRVVYNNFTKPFREMGFMVGKVGRTYAHGYWALKGRGLKPVVKTDSGKWSTAAPVLMTYYSSDPWVLKLIEYKKRVKVVTTYLDTFPRKTYQGRLYGHFNQTGTKTGRLSSSGPNLQNLPAHGALGPRVRGLFKGSLIIGDYSQLEPRLMAHFSGDPVLVDIYRNNHDLYIKTAEGIFGRTVTKEDDERQICKTLILALGYGAGAGKIATTLCLNGFTTSKSTAAGYLKELQQLYHVFFDWKDVVVAEAKRKGYVTTLSGRHRRLRKTFSEKWNHKLIGYGERQAVNAVVQGSAGDIVRHAMLAWPSHVGPEAALRLLCQVHDELIWEYGLGGDKQYLVDLKAAGEEPAGEFSLRVPLVFEPAYCDSWADKGGTPVVFEEAE